MKDDTRAALAKMLLGWADDELVLGQRNAEWCGHAPILEEDIAFANIALDEIGHAGLWYGILADLLDEDRDTYPDRLVYQRPPDEFRNVQLVELPRGDWAFTIVRQFLFDSWEVSKLRELVQSSYSPMAEVAAKVHKEELYHIRHSAAWVKRLGLGTAESNRRMQRALDRLWPLTGQLGFVSPEKEMLIKEGILPSLGTLRTDWATHVTSAFKEADLSVPEPENIGAVPRTDHTDHHRVMILELQSVVRQHPHAEW